jgi:hypothetical protein
MGMSHLKIINASQGNIHEFKNLKRKLYNCNASIYFNQQYLRRQLTPGYANIKAPKTSPASKRTQHKLPTLRIKDGTKHLYSKNQKLNSDIHHPHLSLANTWNGTWPYIHNTIENTLQKEMKTRYKKLDTKINKLTKAQTVTPKQTQNFYRRVVNNTNIPFSKQEMTLLHKGLKYNLHTKSHKWLENLALEAETAVSKLPTSDRETYGKVVAERITTLHQSNKHPTTPKVQQETKTIKSIKSKLKTNNATVTRADKGNTLVILPTEQYKSKMQNFTQANNLLTMPTDPTKSTKPRYEEQ